MLFLAPALKMICESLRMPDTAERECKARHLHFICMRLCVGRPSCVGFILIGFLEEVPWNASCCLNSGTVQTWEKVAARRR